MLMCVFVCVCVFSGSGPSFDMREVADRLSVLKKEVDELEREERQLDSDTDIVNHYVDEITMDLANQK